MLKALHEEIFSKLKENEVIIIELAHMGRDVCFQFKHLKLNRSVHYYFDISVFVNDDIHEFMGGLYNALKMFHEGVEIELTEKLKRQREGLGPNFLK